MKNCILLIMVCSVLYSCSNSTDEGKSDFPVYKNVKFSDSLLIVNSGGYHLSVELPKSMLVPQSKFAYRGNFGDVELFVNPAFHIYIAKDQTSIEDMKNELKGEGLFSRTFIDETENEILFESKLPDDTTIGYGWIKRIETEGSPLVIRVDSQANYSKQDIRMIQDKINSLTIYK